MQEYQKVMGSEDLQLEQQTYYNVGNTLYKLGKLPESILACQQALKMNPDDIDTKYNLEYVRRKLKDNKDEQNQDQQNQQQQQQQQDQQNQQQQQGDDEQDQQDQQQQQQQQQGDEEQEQQGEQQNQQSSEQLSKEDAERILDALKNDEKDIQKKRKVKSKGRYRVEKDW